MADFQRLYKDFEDNNIGLVFLSAEDNETSRKLIDRRGVEVPFAYGVDAEALSSLTGCYYDDGDKYMEATGFLIKPDKRLYLGSYSQGAVGRIRADNAFSIIRYYQTEDASVLPEQG